MANPRRPAQDGDSHRNQGATTEKKERLILLVEDDDRLREMIGAVLRSEGYEVVELTDGMEGLNYLGASLLLDDDRRCPDLVISDIRMPTFSGLDLLVGLRDQADSPPVMLVTAVKGEEIRREARRLGASCVVSKPFDIDSFLYAVEQSLEGRTRRRTPTPTPEIEVVR